MNKESRTFKSLRNSGVALFIFAINLILQFVSRKVFIDNLGTEVMGLNTTAASLLSFLNLAELGVGAAVISTLYKPLSNNDIDSINEIVSLQGWLYRNIALIIIGGSIILMLFFPVLFSKTDLPLWYAYTTFIVLLTSSLLSYFANYREIVLSANQQEYVIQYAYRGTLLIKIFFQILAVYLFEHGYIWWLFLEFIFTFVASFVLNKAIDKACPLLKTSVKKGKMCRSKYPVVITRIKQFFFHKFAGFALSQTSPLIIYGYASLTMVAIYGNYMIVVNGVLSLLNAIFNSMGASVGNLVAEDNRVKILDVFKELLVSRFFIVGTLAFFIYKVSDPLIVHWLGAEMLLDKTTVLLIVLIFFLNTVRSVVDSFINAYGLFRDVWAPIVEAIINITLSIILGYFYGIHGILTGVLVSLLIIVFTWKPYFLFKNGIKQPITIYIQLYVKLLLILGLTIILANSVLEIIPLNPMEEISDFFLYLITCLLVFSLILFMSLYLCDRNMRSFVKRFNLIKRVK